ncbi:MULTISPECIES: hypothetical protein [Butyricimonas]|jgi:hypothetical protein|uniref:DUF4625 domain-containing protein n=1 Tax=Butyricimonas hominis TaxID=2763032 RepID=A0ABR7D3I6_9BACT|nr:MULTISPECIES: hypothetical protein [Butyricimonas]MBC5622045.1 hypothetical protein [Butyricimonas hominis]
MKSIYSVFFLVFALWSCHDVKVGYLKADNAEYDPTSIVVRKELDPEEDELRIMNDANWVSPKIQGVLGTNPLNYELVNVTATEGGDAEAFKQEVVVRGGGIMELPLHTKVPKGHYLVSLRVYNEDYSAELKNAFTFIVE